MGVERQKKLSFLEENSAQWKTALNYSLAARLQDNSPLKSPTKVKTKRKLQQFTVSGWLIMNGGENGSETFKAGITYNIKCQYSYQPLFA